MQLINQNFLIYYNDSELYVKNQPRGWYPITYTYKAGGVDYAAVEFDGKK